MDNKPHNIKCEYAHIKKIVEALPIFKKRFTEHVCLKYNYRRIIYKIFDTANNFYATAKFIIKHNIDDDNLSLINFVMNNRHENLGEIYELGSIGIFYVVLIKYIEGVRLNDFIRGNHDAIAIRSAISGILEGLYFLHSNNILHCDIKPSNIIVDSNNTTKIIDFDMLLRIDGEYVNGNVIMGTYPYIPKEIMTKKIYYLKSDIWGLGVSIIRCLFELKNIKFPGTSGCDEECGTISENINSFNYDNIDLSFALNHKIDTDILMLIKKMVLNDVSNRPSSFEALKMLKNQI